MNKRDVIVEISKRTGQTMQNVTAFLDCFRDLVKEKVSEGEEVSVTGFIKFYKTRFKARNGETHFKDSRVKDNIEWSVPAKDVVSAKLCKTYRIISEEDNV